MSEQLTIGFVILGFASFECSQPTSSLTKQCQPTSQPANQWIKQPTNQTTKQPIVVVVLVGLATLLSLVLWSTRCLSFQLCLSGRSIVTDVAGFLNIIRSFEPKRQQQQQRIVYYIFCAQYIGAPFAGTTRWVRRRRRNDASPTARWVRRRPQQSIA